MKESRINSAFPLPAGILTLACAAVVALPSKALCYVLDSAGVWDIPNARRVAFDPTKGKVGNMGKDGVPFYVYAPPDTAQAGVQVSVEGAFGSWSVLGSETVRLNFKLSSKGADAKVTAEWSAIGEAGLMENAAVNFNNESIKLNKAKTLRRDGWSLDYTKTYTSTDPTMAGQNPPDVISEYDAYTVAIHEVGHAVGLGHPKETTTVMSPQDLARQKKDGLWQSVVARTPAPGQPRKLNQTDLPAGSLIYSNPRANLADDDKLGAKTLYSAPKGAVAANANPMSPGGGHTYSYTLQNLSAAGTDFYARDVILPVAPDVLVTDLVAPAGWSLVRESADVKLSWLGALGGEPAGDSSIVFSFESPDAPIAATPNIHWDLPNLASGVATGGDDEDADENMTPGFDTANFTVMDGTFDYQFNDGTDQWDIVPLAQTIVPGTLPVPEPGLISVWAGVALTALRRRHRGRR